MTGSVVAVDVGGTSMKGARVDHTGAIVAETVRATPNAEGPAAVVDAIESLVLELVDTARPGAQAPEAVAVVVPGVVDAEAGVARFAGNLGWRDIPLRARLAAATGLPVVVDHDVRAAGVGERAAGALRGRDDGLLVMLGTGIAAVLLSGGVVTRGALGMSGELGHIPVWPGGEPCPCGQRGCLERYASAAAVVRGYVAGGGGVGGGDGELSARTVAGRLGVDPAADRAWATATEALGVALVSCTMLLDPEMIVLGGGLSAAGEALRDPVAAALAAGLAWRRPPTVVCSPLRARAGVIGAAVLAWRVCGRDGAEILAGRDPGG